MDIVLQYASNLVQIIVGLIAVWSGWNLRHLPRYRWPMWVAGFCLILTGVAGVANVGALSEINAYRRPLFILERGATALVFLKVVMRNKILAAVTTSERELRDVA